jgi:hypothetical protein
LLFTHNSYTGKVHFNVRKALPIGGAFSLIRFNVYEKTGSLTKLQQVMGHSSLQVSLTYLRGLEVRQLDQDDMPSLLNRG